MQKFKLGIIIKMFKNFAYFENFLKEVSGNVDIREVLRGLSSYRVYIYKIQEISPRDALKMYESIQEKFYKKKIKKLNNSWFENQLRIFVWILVYYIAITDRQMNTINSQDIHFFSLIFPYKNPKLFAYQIKALEKNVEINKHWEDVQVDLLKSIQVIKGQKIKWSDISKELYYLSDSKYFRTPKQCREHWNNYLDPKKVKGQWTIEQYLQIFTFVQKYGKKWAKIVKLFKNSRNEHSVKNKYNSLIKKQKKFNIDLNQQEIRNMILDKIKKTLFFEKERKTEISFLDSKSEFSQISKNQHIQQKNLTPSMYETHQSMFKLQKSENHLHKNIVLYSAKDSYNFDKIQKQNDEKKGYENLFEPESFEGLNLSYYQVEQNFFFQCNGFVEEDNQQLINI